jgi:hypothetical protein
MRLLRLLVITATLFSLPGYGLAAAGHVRGCPERAPAGAADTAMAGMDMTHKAMDGMAMDGTAMPGDCCPDAAHQQPHGKSGDCGACQAGHGCKSPQGVQLLHAPVLTIVAFPQAVLTDPAPHASLCIPDGLLRPPKFA